MTANMNEEMEATIRRYPDSTLGGTTAGRDTGAGEGSWRERDAAFLQTLRSRGSRAGYRP